MRDWPVGLSTGCFYRKSIFDVLDVIARSGFSMIEICSSRAHLDYHDQEMIKKAARAIGKNSLEPVSFHAPFHEGIDITAFDQHQRDTAAAEILCAVNAAAHLGVRYFILHPGPEKTERPPPEELIRRMQNAAQVLNRIAEECSRRSMLLLLENMLPHLLFGSLSSLLWMMGSVDPLKAGLCLDTGHAYLSGDLYAAAQKFSGHLHLVHINDNRGNRDDHLPPGKGAIDWGCFCSSLRASGFEGTCILEISGDYQNDDETLLQEVYASHSILLEKGPG